MPVHQFVHDHQLTERVRNYWGYNSIAYLARTTATPLRWRREHHRVQGDGQGAARRGIEVILDVVYNHTRRATTSTDPVDGGVDNHAYYRLIDEDPRQYLDFTGTGNSLNARNPHVLQMIMDSLRYWVDGDARRRVPLRLGFDARP